MKRASETGKTYAAISAIGKDRPGIVAGVSGVLYEAGCNLEDSSMTILGGEFAIILIVALPSGLALDDLDQRFNAVRKALGLSIFLKTVSSKDLQHRSHPAGLQMISVYGVDKPGIVYKVASLLAKNKVNITDVNTQRIVQKGSPLYVMMLEVAPSKSFPMERLRKKLEELGRGLNVTITTHPIETLTL